MPTLYYVADPMCSWCWGFAAVLTSVRAALPESIAYRLVLGGLAPDCDDPMPDATRRYVQSAWDAVEEATGASFNRDFWSRCEPRRSTWPACRAVLAADTVSPGSADAMFAAIQEAYYRDARNPSVRETLVAIATEIGIDPLAFRAELDSTHNHAQLREDLSLRDRLRVTGFPSLCFADSAGVHLLARGHANAEDLLRELRTRMGDAPSEPTLDDGATPGDKVTK